MTDKEEQNQNELVLSLDHPRVFERSAWQNFVRWIAFAAIMALNIACVVMTVSHIGNAPNVPNYWAKQFVGYIILVVCNLAVLPSVLLEARKVEVFADRMIIHNLIYKSTIRWEEIRKVSAPIFLKFAIIKTPKFFQLINKRDVQRFPDLIQIIRDKATNAETS